jgi:hypothetical protein
MSQQHQIKFAHDYSQQDVKLLEVPDDLLKLIESGELTEFVFKAPNHPNQNVVLCTDDKTYTVTQVETSNSIFLRNKSHPTRDTEIQASVTCMYEVTEKKSNSIHQKQIRELLTRRPHYSPGPNSMQIDTGSWSVSELEKHVLASRNEILRTLHQISDAVEVEEGHYQLVDPTVFNEYCSLVFLTLQSEGWNLKSVPVDECVNILKREGQDPILARHCLLSFQSDNNSNNNSSNNNIELDYRKITIHYGSTLLKQKSLWTRKQFMQSLTTIMADVSDSDKPSLSDLINANLCVEEDKSGELFVKLKVHSS